VLVVSGALDVVFELDLIWSYVIALTPAVLYTIICLKCKTNIQLYAAAILR
jgi:hypothetical protein